AKRDVVLFAAREILHRGSKAFMRKRADVHLNAFEPERHAGLVRSLPKHLLRFGVIYDPAEGFDRSGSGDENIQVANRLAPAPQAAGRLHLLDAGEGRKIGDEFIRSTPPKTEQEAACALAIRFDGAQNFFF